MTTSDDLLNHGQKQLREVALRYANGHGLHPDSIEWDQQYDEWWLKVSTADHSVRVVFSRNAFASLAMRVFSCRTRWSPKPSGELLDVNGVTPVSCWQADASEMKTGGQ